MKVRYIANNGRLMDTIEKFYIYRETKHSNSNQWQKHC